MEIITNFLYQFVFTVGVIVAFGLLISFCRRTFCRLAGRSGGKLLLITGAVGTPIHELSHALMCLIFGHKIVEIKLYQPRSVDGVLGYVNHSYNPKNLYHQIGNFFIGVAPILCGSGVLLLLMRIMVPDLCSDVIFELQSMDVSSGFFDLSTYGSLLAVFWNILISIFAFSNWGNILWWIFIVLALMVSSHMELSTLDIKGSLRGFLTLAGLFLVMDVILYFVSPFALEAVTVATSSFALSCASFLAISGVFSGIMLLAALAVKGITRLVKR